MENSLLNIYEKNKNSNKKKIQFYDFLTYCLKSEISIQEVQSIFYWIGFLEIFVFVISIGLFLTSAKQFWRNWFFIFHFIRALIGFDIIINLPETSDVINKLDNFENLSVEEIQKKIYNSYSQLITDNKEKIRKLCTLYWIISGIDLFFDIINFILYLHDFGNYKYNFRNSMSLFIISILFSKLNIFFNIFFSL